MKLYGLKNCDTCKKAVKFLANAGIQVEFIDVRADGVPQQDMAVFWETFGDKLVNTRSTTWRQLSDEARSKPALGLLQDHPTLMKRPVIRHGKALFLGWNDGVEQALLGEQA